MKQDEIDFLLTFYQMKYEHQYEDCYSFSISPRRIINMPLFKRFMHYKRAWYLLEKWSNKGWYDYGVTLDLGWLTDEGIAKVKELLADDKASGV